MILEKLTHVLVNLATILMLTSVTAVFCGILIKLIMTIYRNYIMCVNTYLLGLCLITGLFILFNMKDLKADTLKCPIPGDTMRSRAFTADGKLVEVTGNGTSKFKTDDGKIILFNFNGGCVVEQD